MEHENNIKLGLLDFHSKTGTKIKENIIYITGRKEKRKVKILRLQLVYTFSLNCIHFTTTEIKVKATYQRFLSLVEIVVFL